jgi:hypothetical protein
MGRRPVRLRALAARRGQKNVTIVDHTPADDAWIDECRQRLDGLVHLYHYTSVEKFHRIEHVLKRSQFWMTSYPELNDPYDGQVSLDCAATPERIREYWEFSLAERGKAITPEDEAKIQTFIAKRDDPEHHKWMRAQYQAEMDRLAIFCLSEPLGDIPMWSYYANSHRGVSLRFRARLLYGSADSYPPFRVAYEKDYKACSFYNDSRFRRTQLGCSTKSDAWSHEEEWRLVSQKGSGYFPFDPVALDGIILGCRISASHEARLRRIVGAREPKIELLRAQRAEGEYELEISPA